MKDGITLEAMKSAIGKTKVAEKTNKFSRVFYGKTPD